LKKINISRKSQYRFNPKREPLTREKLQELSGLNFSDLEAEEAIDSIQMLAKILYDFTPTENGKPQ